MKALYIGLLLTGSLLAVAPARAQYAQHLQLADYYQQRAVGKERTAQRIAFGVGKTFINGDVTISYTGPDENGKPFADSVTRKLKAKSSFVVYGGTFYPLALMGERSQLTFDLELMGGYAEMTHDSVDFGHGTAVYNQSKTVLQGGLQFGFSFRSGTDVALTTETKNMFAVGAGLNIGSFTDYETPSGLPILVMPYLKAEYGFYWGVAIKARGVFYFGETTSYLSGRQTNLLRSDDAIETRSTASYGFNLGVMAYPFTYKLADRP